LAISAPSLKDHRTIWQHKAVLRVIYEDFYRRILAECRPGRILEIGGGIGNLKSYAPSVVSIDWQAAPWLDAAADAQSLPFRQASFDNIVLVDVLHHIENPCRFFSEAVDALRPGGRIVMIEPCITPLSWLFYKLLHSEPVDMSQDPLALTPPDAKRHPFDANQAIPTLLFFNHRARFEKQFSSLRVVRLERLSLWAYPLSGGFQSWSLISAGMCRFLLRLENRLLPWLGFLGGFRMLCVVESQLGYHTSRE
jgi:SAM-dependent methyltransferase